MSASGYKEIVLKSSASVHEVRQSIGSVLGIPCNSVGLCRHWPRDAPATATSLVGKVWDGPDPLALPSTDDLLESHCPDGLPLGQAAWLRDGDVLFVRDNRDVSAIEHSVTAPPAKKKPRQSRLSFGKREPKLQIEASVK